MIKDLIEQINTFYKLAAENRSIHDIQDALEHASSFVTKLDGGILPSWWFDITEIPKFPINELYEYEDINNWLETERGELVNVSNNDVRDYLGKLRGSHAKKWPKEKFSPIIIVDTPIFTCIGDGRGRVNFAIGMNYKYIPALMLKLKPLYYDKIKMSRFELEDEEYCA